MKKRPRMKMQLPEERPIYEAAGPVEVSPLNPVEYMHYKTQLRIREEELNREVSEQPQTFSDVADRYALARSLRDEAKDKLKTAEAEAYLDQRAKLEEADQKVTEKQLEALVQISPHRRKAFKRLINAERELLEWEGLKEAWKDRSFMIREISGLHLSKFFSDSSIKSADHVHTEAKAYAAQQAMNKRRKERNNRGLR